MDPTIRQARSSELVPFVGAGASRALTHRRTGQPLMPTWREFLDRAASELPSRSSAECRDALAANNLVLAATIVRESISKPAWVRLLKHSFDIDRSVVNPGDLHLQRELWLASRGMIITTNYDDSLAWEVPAGLHALRTYGLEAPVDITSLLDYGTIRPVLWHLHGRIRYPNSIVLAADGYESLYGSDTTIERRYRSALISLTVFVATKSLLFVGFSLNDSAIVNVLHDMYVTFNESDKSHYLICQTAEEKDIRARLAAASLDNIELIVIDNFGDPLIDVLRELRPANAAAVSSPSLPAERKPVYMRRRCRTVVAGSPEFIRTVLPVLTEHRPSTAGQFLADLVLDTSDRFESAILRSLMFEFQGRINLMLDAAAAYPGTDTIEGANCALYSGIALDKLNRLDEALLRYNAIIEEFPASHELNLCARFNRAVVREKLDLDADEFAPLIDDRSATLSSGELLWTKAFNMELIRCTRRGLRFRYTHLLEAAIAAEVTPASTGFAKTVINWSEYSGRPLEPEFIDQVELIARRSAITVRLPILRYLQTVIADESLAKAMQDALDATGTNETLLRLIDGSEPGW
jgi:hypothetical protein